ncbi:MAG: substrate-binding domain-containing protein [Cyanobacteria bacterium P01_G01_bin.54]
MTTKHFKQKKIKDSLINMVAGVGALALIGCSTPASDNSNLETPTSTITIGGSSEVYEVLEILTEAYELEREGVEFEFLPPSQTSAGIIGIESETIDIGGVSRAVTPKEAGDALRYLPLVETPLVLAIHETVTGITDITTDQIQAIYSGEITNWQELGGPDAAIALFDFVEDENEKKVLRAAYLGAELEVTDAAIVFAEDDELMDVATSTEFSLAALPFEEELEDLPITILTIDGIEPSPDNLRSGAYKMVLPLGVVLAQEPSAATQQFIEFTQSEEGQAALRAAEYTVIQP